MNWKLIDIKQETNHPFLNFFTLTYEVEEDDGKHTQYDYYMVSRRSRDQLLVKTSAFQKPDGVVMPLYYINENTKEVSFLLTKQYRPAVGAYMTSFTAGLLDKEDEIFSACKREAREESGAIITDLEILSPSAPTSVGLSDEINAVVLGRIIRFEKSDLEEFEDIRTDLFSIDEIKKMLNDKNYMFPVNIRILLLYLMNRFENKEVIK